MTHTLTQVMTWNDDDTPCWTGVTLQPGPANTARANRIRRLKEQRKPYTKDGDVVTVPGEHLTTTLTWDDQP